MQSEYGYTIAKESELNDLLAGKDTGISFSWPGYSMSQPVPIGFTGVLWKSRPGNFNRRPLALVAREEDLRRLCGRFAQLRADLSPLTAWCHLFTPQRFDSLESAAREPDLRGLEAAWTGLAIAEAQLLSEKSLRGLRLAACLATESFAIARTRALWGDIPDDDIAKRFDDANRFFRIDNGVQPWEKRTTKLRVALQPIWSSLNAVLRGGTRAHDSVWMPLVDSLMALDAARQQQEPNEAARFVTPLLESVPEARGIVDLSEMAPEQRLRMFDELVGNLNAAKDQNRSLRHSALALVAGYLATVAAGGTPTLSLAEKIASSWPEVTGWAYVVGGIGERVIWTSGFNGLGRLVSRELVRPFRIDEPPTCDFALDEASVLVDPKLPDPLVHLRIKQGRIATVALLPGVNISIPISDSTTQELKVQPSQVARQAESVRVGRDPMALIADAVWPHLRTRVEQCIRLAQDDDLYSPNYERPRNKRRGPSQIPLRTSKK